MNYTYKPYDLDRTVRLVINCVVAAATVWLLYLLRNVLLPFCVAGFIAYMLEPIVGFNRRVFRLKGRLVAIILTLAESVGALFGLYYFLSPIVGAELSHTAELIARYSQSSYQSIPFVPEWVHQLIRSRIDIKQISALLHDQTQLDLIESVIGYTWNLLTSGVAMIINVLSWLVVFLYLIFIMLDYDRLSVALRGMVPPRYRSVVYRLGRDVERSMNHYFRGQALIAFIVGVLFSIGFSIIDMPLAILLGMFVGLLNMVPYLQLVSFIPATLLCLVSAVDSGVGFWVIFAKMFAVYCVVQAIQDLYLTPRIMGKAMGLNPAIILLSLSVWGTLLGFLGLIIALPLTTLCLAYYDRYIKFLIKRSEHAAAVESQQPPSALQPPSSSTDSSSLGI